MSSPDYRIAKLIELGWEWPAVPKPAGAYVPALQTGNLVYVSGQLPMKAGKLIYTGKVGDVLSLSDAFHAAALCFVNCLASLQYLELTPDKIEKVIRITGHVQCHVNFNQIPQVINGASELCLQVFGEDGRHTRAALGAYSLPLDACVELETIFQVKS